MPPIYALFAVIWKKRSAICSFNTEGSNRFGTRWLIFRMSFWCAFALLLSSLISSFTYISPPEACWLGISLLCFHVVYLEHSELYYTPSRRFQWSCLSGTLSLPFRLVVKRALGDATVFITDINRCPGGVFSPPTKVAPHHHIFWCPPPVGNNNVNTDGSDSNSQSQDGIGGIFRDDQVNPLLHYAKIVNVNSIIGTEILAIRESFLIVVASRWANSTSFIFKSDLPNVMLWFFQPSKTGGKYQNAIREVFIEFGYFIQWFIAHVHRSKMRLLTLWSGSVSRTLIWLSLSNCFTRFYLCLVPRDFFIHLFISLVIINKFKKNILKFL